MNKKLLIIDDNQDLREVLKLYFCHAFQVVLAEDGEQGLDKLNQEKFDLIITDYNMPIMNGIEFSIRAKECFPDIPIIMMSAKNQIPSHIIAKNLIQGFFAKPFPLEELLLGIQGLLKIKK